MNNNIFGYKYKDTWIYHLSGATKLIYFLALSITSMVSYDIRYIGIVLLISLILFQQAHIKWSQIRLIVKLIAIFSILNLVTIFIFSPNHGAALYGTRHVLLSLGYFTVTKEQLFYELNVAAKYVVAVPLALIFLITTNPSEFAASLNKIGLPYRISYATSLALRYIPDVQSDYQDISMAQQARGYEISRKGKLWQRLKQATHIVMPLIFSSLDKIEVISHAMELRRFGLGKKRTWYMSQHLKPADYCTDIVVLLLVVLAFVFMMIDHGRFYNPFI